MTSFQVLVNGTAETVGGRKLAFVTTRIVKADGADSAKVAALSDVRRRMAESDEMTLNVAQAVSLSVLEINPIPMGEEGEYSDTGFIFYDPK